MDFKAAFDSMDRYYIWKAFSHYGLPCKYIRIIQAFFNGTVSAVRQNGELSEWFEVSSGSGQGDIQSPPLLMSASMWLLREQKTTKWCPTERFFKNLSIRLLMISLC